MPKIGYRSVFFWSAKEKALHNTERHQIFQKELYLLYRDNTNNSHLTHEEWETKLKAFKEKNFDLLDSEKSVSVDVDKPRKSSSTQADSKLTNKEG